MQTSGDLYKAFRSDVGDEATPFLWSDTDIFRYMNEAYQTFVRLTGGVADSTSDITQIPVVAGEMYATVSPSILRFRQAYLVSTGEEVAIVNEQDMLTTQTDYGLSRPLVMDATAGPVRYMVVGMGRTQEGGVIRWVQVPTEDDIVSLSVYRMPLEFITGSNKSFTFPDIGTEHIEPLLLSMKSRAYAKQDADAFNNNASKKFGAEFRDYCLASKAEWERFKHKNRAVQYGGI